MKINLPISLRFFKTEKIDINYFEKYIKLINNKFNYHLNNIKI